MKVLLVTIAIGEKYLETYNKYYRISQENYAKKCGYDFKVCTEYLYSHLQHSGTIYFNKFLVCNQDWSKNYDFIIFIDSDIYININSPPIHSIMDYGTKIGIADEFSQPTPNLRIEIQKALRFETSATDFYKLAGYDLNTTKVFNSGVLVLQPKYHADYLDNLFKGNVLKAIAHPRGPLFEQSTLGYHLQKDDMYICLPNEFNTLWFYYKILNINIFDLFKQTYFLHFAGQTDIEAPQYLDRINTLN
jgi:hypothetical protein